MKIMTGDAAVRISVSGARILDTADGIILFPGTEGPGNEGPGTEGPNMKGPGIEGPGMKRPGIEGHGMKRTGQITRYRPRYAGHLPEFWPSDAAEACRMARSARLYAETYRTPVLLRLPAEIRREQVTAVPKKKSMTERRSADYIMDREKQEATKHRGCRIGSSEANGTKVVESAARVSGGVCNGIASPNRPAIPEEALSDSCWNPILGHGGKGIIVRGPAYKKVLRILNGYSGVRVLKIGTAWPLPESQIRRFLQSVRTALVLDDTQEDLLIPVYAVKGKYELTGTIVPFEGMEDSSEDLASAVLDLTGRDAVMEMLRMRA